MATWTLNLGHSPILTEQPDFLGKEKLREPLTADDRMIFWERLMERHGRHPYLLVRYALPLQLRCPGQALALLEEAQAESALRDVAISPEFVASVGDFRRRIEGSVQARETIPDHAFSQPWVPVIRLPLPTDDLLCTGHARVQSDWTHCCPKQSERFQRYLRSVAIETNHIEGTFLLRPESARCIIRDGVSTGRVNVAPRSVIRDRKTIATILNDTLSAYDLLYDVIEDPSKFTPEIVCAAHRRVMLTARFEGRYVPAGVTRSITRDMVGINSGEDGFIQCCPHEEVDQELSTICELTRGYLRSGRMGPFALSTWLHLALARCHPFNDGDGRITRLFASIPLIKHGYPPILVPMTDKAAYFKAINQAYKGDFGPLAECFGRGMQAGINVACEEDSSASVADSTSHAT
ncbi:unnamed protein product [Peniophora sp. CBMAI 1063]|nr:unnamed protein product [Peniophora sp. CBMAI 1063]